MNDYYVYLYWRLDIMEVFYVGKGCGRRWKYLWNRNSYFENIINKYPIAVEIVKDNLTEEQANDIECWLINELVFIYGFSINIKGNRSSEKDYHLVNCTWGGEGASGCNPFENKTEKEMKMIKKKISEANKGKEVSEETKEKIRQSNLGKHLTEETKRKISENHAKYFKGKTHTNETKEKMSKSKKGKYIGKHHPRAKVIICLTTKEIFFNNKRNSKTI